MTVFVNSNFSVLDNFLIAHSLLDADDLFSKFWV